MMDIESSVIRVKGRSTRVPSVRIEERTVIVTGTWLKTAALQDENYVEGEPVPNPERFISILKNWDARPDILTFVQKITDPEPRFRYFLEWHNFAAIPITTYQNWLKSQIKEDVRKSLKRATREGLIVKATPCDDAFLRGAKGIYDECPVRQGRHFWHYEKAFEQIKELHATYLDRAQHIGAYRGDELIGFIKLVFTDNIARTMHIISKEAHRQSRPNNALLAKAVEICEQRGMAFLVYGQYEYLGKQKDSLTDFKRRHGFQEMRFPRYFIPLSLKGTWALKLRCHHGFKQLIPTPISQALRSLRSKSYGLVHALRAKYARTITS